MSIAWRVMFAAAIAWTNFSANAFYCDPSEFLTLRADGKTLAVSDKQLAALPQHELTTSTYWNKKGTYRGPYLRDVVALTKRTRVRTLSIFTWDNFKVDIPYSDLSKYGVILATSFNGKRLRLDDWGPLFIMYPYDQYREIRRPAGLNKMAWQVCRIDVS